MERRIEILSPAGSYDCLKAAINAGADAVYVGGTRFGARAFAENFHTEQLLEAIDYVHLHGKKIYLTINTLLKERELQEELYAYLLPYYRQGIDAVIVQDMGVLQFVKEHFPGLTIHASTQMTVTDVLGAKLLEEQGVERVVTSREMHVDEIREIARQTNLEIESFVHGALCYCYSGQCLYSSILGGRSGNRGQCAQPCRLPYRMQGEKKPQYLLSPKDICTLELIPELVECGIYSFKIEGRMKKPEYVALVTAMYRKYTDLYLEHGREGFVVDEKDKGKLLDLYNRGGFHEGYYHTQNGREMMSLKRPNHAGIPALKVMRAGERRITAQALAKLQKGDVIELSDERENYTMPQDVQVGQTIEFLVPKNHRIRTGTVLSRVRNEALLRQIQEELILHEKKVQVRGVLDLKCDEPAKLTLQCGKARIQVTGAPPQQADKQPLDAQRIEAQMRKTGNTEFEFADIKIHLDGDLFLPMQALNQLRRDGLLALQQKLTESYRRDGHTECKATAYDVSNETHSEMNQLYAYVEEAEQFYAVLDAPCVRRVYLDSNALSEVPADGCIRKAKERGKEIYLALPHIFRSNTRRLYETEYRDIIDASWDGMLIRNMESYVFLREQHYPGNIVTDYNLYQFNRCAKQFWKEQGVESTTAPLELNVRELQDVGLDQSELVVYGNLPMMISAQCIQKTTGGCTKKRGRRSFVDRYQKEFYVKNQCVPCYNVIYNTEPLMLTDQYEEIKHLAPKALRLQFTLESASQVGDVIEQYEKTFLVDKKSSLPECSFTRGHFKRGIK